jgi:hypothetical protein
MLDIPLAETFIRPTNRIDFAHIPAMMCGNLPDRSPKDPAMAITPKTMVASTVQTINDRVRSDAAMFQ